MYFPIGWPKVVNLSTSNKLSDIIYICCDAVKILVAALGTNFISISYANPIVPIAYYQRSTKSLSQFGENKLLVWKPDSRQIIVLTNFGSLLLYKVEFITNGRSTLTQIDSPSFSLKRDSAELFIRENIPRLYISEVCNVSLKNTVTAVCCISLTELLIATMECELIRILWTDLENVNSLNDKECNSISIINLRNIPFYMHQNCHAKCFPTLNDKSFVSSLEYSPFIGGCAAVFNDHRAAFLVAMHLRIEIQNMHGLWVLDVEDATVCNVNHKFRLLAFGQSNSNVSLYTYEEATGSLEFSHRLSFDTSVTSETLGSVKEMKWSPDGCVLVVAWANGGISLWSTFGTLLMTSLNWDFNLGVDLINNNPLQVLKLEWSTEGYHLFMICKKIRKNERLHEISSYNVLQLKFVKSTLCINPCMASHPHILLQGDDTLYLNLGERLKKQYFGTKFFFPNNRTEATEYNTDKETNIGAKDISNVLSESKYWTIIQLPLTYASTNWPIRYSTVDAQGLHLAVAGRTGLAHYSLLLKKWKLFGNESQEKDFVVSGGLLWWKNFIILGCYSITDQTDEIRCYPKDYKLDNRFTNKIQARAPITTINIFDNHLIILTTDGIVSVFNLFKRCDNAVDIICSYEVDVKSICIHPACIVSLTVTNLKNDYVPKFVASTNGNEGGETIIVNVCGRILMIQRDPRNKVINSLMASCLASCVECFWLSNADKNSPSMRDCLWLYSGSHGMRVWMPILPPANEPVRNAHLRMHTFMSKRIMLSFSLKLYPLAIHFDSAIVLGVDNETILYASELQSHFSLPFCTLERKSQVYLHKILRQLIKRNLGYNAWEIAKSCQSLPYFPHALELLLHEVLEKEATSKEPIPDALLPSVLDFIREFPIYLQTIVQCARKTEIALWPHLFSVAGKPTDLFQQCLESDKMDTAASYLIILQNLEPSTISKQYATFLLDISLKNRKWELAKDLIRFLKAIDPNEIDSPRSSLIVNAKIAPTVQTKPQVTQSSEAFNMILGPITRERSFSTSMASHITKDKKDKITIVTKVSSNEKILQNNLVRERSETFSVDTILQCHAQKLLQNYKIIDLGYMTAFLDFHLVTWLTKEANQSARLKDFVEALACLHEELMLPLPFLQFETNYSIMSLPNDNFQSHHTRLLSYNSGNKSLSQVSESGYFSSAKVESPSSVNESQIHPHHNFAQNGRETLSEESFECSQNKMISQNDEISTYALGLNYMGIMNINPKILPEKLSIKIRYLLQLFVEANCTDYSLVLSILLQDASSIGRIINVVMRSDSISACRRLKNALNHLSQWCFARECVYRTFMINIQPHIYVLDHYIMSSSYETEKKDFRIQNSEVLGIFHSDDEEPTINNNINNLSQTNYPSNSNKRWSLKTDRQLRQKCQEDDDITHLQSSFLDQKKYITTEGTTNEEINACIIM